MLNCNSLLTKNETIMIKFYIQKVIWILVMFSVTYGFSQSVSRKSFDYQYLNYPQAPIAGAKTYKVSIYTGKLSIIEKSIKGKKTYKKLTKDKPSVNYFSFQKLSLSGNNADLNVEVAYGTLKMTGKVEKSRTIPCKYEGAELKKENIMECPAYYYEVAYDLPCIVRVTDKTGKVLYAEKVSGKGLTHFGYDASGMSGYLKKAELAAAFNKSGTASLEKSAFIDKLFEANVVIQRCLHFSNTKDKFKIGYGKGKAHDYSDLESAANKVLSAFKTGKNIQAGLKSSIPIWENAVKEVDLSNKNAKINRKVATALRENLALAYMYSNDYDNAKKHAEKFKTLAKYATDQAYNERAKHLLWLIGTRRIQYENNKTVTTSGTKIPADDLLAKITEKKPAVPINFLFSEDKYATFQADVKSSEPVKENITLEDLLSGKTSTSEGGNKYEARVVKSAAQGYMLSMNSWIDKEMESLPLEICELTMLTQLSAPGLKMKTIPKEIGNLKALKVLNLSNNQLSTLPNEIIKCENVKTLNLKNNNFSSSEIAKIQNRLPDCKIKY